MKRIFAILREKFRQNKSDFNGILRLCCTIVCIRLLFHLFIYLHIHILDEHGKSYLE